MYTCIQIKVRQNNHILIYICLAQDCANSTANAYMSISTLCTSAQKSHTWLDMRMITFTTLIQVSINDIDIQVQYQHNHFFNIWVWSWYCCCLVTWLCYQLIEKPGSKAAAVPWLIDRIFLLDVSAAKTLKRCFNGKSLIVTMRENVPRTYQIAPTK